MDPDRFHKIDELFAAASELPPSERLAWLADACPDASLRADVESLLSAADTGTGVIADPLHTVRTDFAASLERDPLIGELCGAWRIERFLGEGGMGAVYLGVREGDRYRQKAAIKLLRFGPAAGESALERFRMERSILAGLEHPNITRLIDGGAYVTPSGAQLPFLAMEYVDGELLLPFAEKRRLGLLQRIALFRKICHAVHFAHQSLIVHRDLKPANILVNGEGEPKLLDFGIAKLIEPTPDAARETATRVFTPDYASPEQMRGGAPLPASDIYSLGAILYHLLTLQRPFDRQALGSGELDRAIAEAEPVRPSARGGPFAGKLAGDLDNIILMALHKDPSRRYKSAEQFAEDLDRYLHRMPVIARRDTFLYRSSKLVRRHWAAIAATAVAFALLSVALATALHEAHIAEGRFRDIRSLANTLLFDLDKEISTVPGNTRARQMLAATARQYLDKLAAAAGNNEGLLIDLVTSYEKLGGVQGLPGQSNLGLTSEAAASYRQAIAILDRLSSKNPRYQERLAIDLGRYGEIASELNRKDEAFALMARSAELLDGLRAKSPSDRELVLSAAQAFDSLSQVYRQAYRSEAALEAARKAVTFYEQALPPNAPPAATQSLALAVSRVGAALRNLGEFDAADVAISRALELQNKIVQANPEDAASRKTIAIIHETAASLDFSDFMPCRDNLDGAISHWLAARAIYANLAEADPHDIVTQVQAASADANLAMVYLRRGRPGDAHLADRLSESAWNTLRAVLRQTPLAGFARARIGLIGSARADILAEHGCASGAVELSQRDLEPNREFASESNYSADNRVQLAGEWMRHAQVLVQCGDRDGVRKATQEADRLLAGLDGDLHRWMTLAFLAGAHHFRLAERMEATARETSDLPLLASAAENYAAAASLWSPWRASKPYVERCVADAIARRDRCRRSAGAGS